MTFPGDTYIFPRMGYRTVNPGSIPAPSAAHLWDQIPAGCEPRRCRACELVFLAGPSQVNHWDHCPENAHRIPVTSEGDKK